LQLPNEAPNLPKPENNYFIFNYLQL